MGQELGSYILRHYRPPGPIASKYIVSKGPIVLIMGPWGSG